MIQQGLNMSRESRRLLDELDKMSAQYNTSVIVTPSQMYIADQLTLKYFTAPILNAIKSKVKQLKKVSSKHFTVEHWVSVLDSMFQNNMSVRREGSVVQIIDGKDVGLSGFQLISKYLIDDYGQQDAEMIYSMIHEYSDIMIRDAINVSISNNVYNIRYVNAILKRELALTNMKMQAAKQIEERADKSNAILNRQVVQHSAIDMAMSQYNWEQAKQNADLEKRMKEMFGE